MKLGFIFFCGTLMFASQPHVSGGPVAPSLFSLMLFLQRLCENDVSPKLIN